MAKWRSHAHGASREPLFGKRDERSRRRRHQLAERSLRIEPFEERKMMAVSPTLVAIIPNEGAVIKSGDTVMVDARDGNLTIGRQDGGRQQAASA